MGNSAVLGKRLLPLQWLLISIVVKCMAKMALLNAHFEPQVSVTGEFAFNSHMSLKCTNNTFTL